MTSSDGGGERIVPAPAPPAPRPPLIKPVIEIAGALAGSTALISALMVYFGWVRTRVLFSEFGVPVEILQLSASDFILRSADVFFKPIMWVTFALGGLGILSVFMATVERTAHRRAKITVRTAVALLAVASAAVGALGMFEVIEPDWAAVALSMSGALIILLYVTLSGSSVGRAPVMMLVVGILLTLAATFWWVSIYAASTGANLARDIGTGALPRPAVIVHSQNDLGLDGAAVPTAAHPNDERSWRYEYRGYKLLVYANRRWLLIPESWHPGARTIILPDDDSVRVDVTSR